MKSAIIAAAVIAVAALGAGSVDAKEQSVTGTWTLTVEHFGLKLELVQKKKAVTGSSTGRTAIRSSSLVDSLETR
jgi:hypothetical protein